MSDLISLKQDLRNAIDASNADGSYTDQGYENVRSAIDALLPHSPLPRPFEAQDRVAGPWRTLFAQFGPRHTAGKPVVHENTLNFVSFSKFPAVPFRNLELEQEIHHASKDYNNVHVIETLDGEHRFRLATFGRYHIQSETPQRYEVEFYKSRIWSEAGHSDDEIRDAFGMPADTPLEVHVPSPKLHSDVVYCDDEIRINFGSVGGIYVLQRVDHSGVTVKFS